MKILKVLLQVLSALLVVIGFVACEEDNVCVNCTLNYNGQTDIEQICEEDFNSTAEFDQYIAAIELIGGSCS